MVSKTLLVPALLAFLAARPAWAYLAPPSGGGEAPPAAPGLFDQIVLSVAQWQRDFHERLAEAMQAATDGDRLWPVLTVAAFAFLYGVFHAVGPGHGKAVVAGYFVGQRASIWRATALGSAIAGVQGVSAIVLVGGLAGILGLAGTRLLSGVPLLEMVSYGLIIALGLHMLYRGLRGKPCCAEADHHHHHHAPGHSARGPSRAATKPGTSADGTIVAGAPRQPAIWPAALAVGVRPCSGALIVLLFASAHQAYPLGAGAVLAMAVGVAITVSAIGIGAIGVHRALDGPAASRLGLATWARSALHVAGASIIVLAGTVMLLGASARGGLLA